LCTYTDRRLAEAVEKRLGYGKVASVRVSTDEDSGRPRGFAHIDFFNPELAEDALRKLQVRK
jgi:RNA recognition motif. (a.k.a. RRM, RBD, or RNP domain)